MRNGYEAFDSDSQVIRTADLWQKYLQRGFADRITRRAPAGPDTDKPVVVDGRGRIFLEQPPGVPCPTGRHT